MKGNSPLFDNVAPAVIQTSLLSKNSSRAGSVVLKKDTSLDNETPKSENAERKMSPKGEEMLGKMKTPEGKNLVKELYRPSAIIGDGGTADALRHEKEMGIANHPRSHLIKARERVRQIEKILARNPNHQDKDALTDLLNDLLDALKGLDNGK